MGMDLVVIWPFHLDDGGNVERRMNGPLLARLPGVFTSLHSGSPNGQRLHLLLHFTSHFQFAKRGCYHMICSLVGKREERRRMIQLAQSILYANSLAFFKKALPLEFFRVSYCFIEPISIFGTFPHVQYPPHPTDQATRPSEIPIHDTSAPHPLVHAQVPTLPIS